jgi:Tfp pilus assembly protein PilN
MPETINLIPKEERIQQTKTKVVKFSTILAVVLLVVVAGIGGYFYYRVYNLKKELKATNTDITNLRSEITSLSTIEIEARNLYKKTTILQSIFDNRIYYSTLLKELEQSVPDKVVVDSFGVNKDNTVAISGSAETYNLVQDFTNKLLSRDIFTSVELNSVGLDSRDGKISFFIIVSYNEDLLHE